MRWPAIHIITEQRYQLHLHPHCTIVYFIYDARTLAVLNRPNFIKLIKYNTQYFIFKNIVSNVCTYNVHICLRVVAILYYICRDHILRGLSLIQTINEATVPQQFGSYKRNFSTLCKYCINCLENLCFIEFCLIYYAEYIPV